MAIYTMGIDVGSTASKCIILKDGKEIVGKSLVDVGTGTSGPARAIEEVLRDADMTQEQLHTGNRLWPQFPPGNRQKADERAFLPRKGCILPVSKCPYRH